MKPTWRAAAVPLLVAALVASLLASCAWRLPGGIPAGRRPRPAEPAPPGGAAEHGYASRLLAQVNAERVRQGLPALRGARCAADSAGRLAAELARDGAVRHAALEPVRRDCRARLAGEAVGASSREPEALVGSWLASTRHRRLLLGAHWTHIGVGAARSASGRWYAVTHLVAR